LTLPAYVLTRCETEMWRLNAALDRSAPPRGRRVLLALERRPVLLGLPRLAHGELKERAMTVGLPIPRYLRARCGCEVR